jgi:hypothetical protein
MLRGKFFPSSIRTSQCNCDLKRARHFIQNTDIFYRSNRKVKYFGEGVGLSEKSDQSCAMYKATTADNTKDILSLALCTPTIPHTVQEPKSSRHVVAVASSAGNEHSMRSSSSVTSCGVPNVVMVEKNRSLTSPF